MEPDRAADRAPAGDRRRLCPPVRHLQAALRPHPGSHGRDLRRGRRPRYPRCPTEEDEGDMTMNFKKMAAGLALGAAVAAVPVLAPHAQEAKHTIVTVVKLAGIAWFNRMAEGVAEYAEATGDDATQVGPASADAALQVQPIGRANVELQHLMRISH